MANRREKVEAVTDFIFLGSKITVDSDCSHEIKKYFLLERKAMTNLDSISKSRDITLLTKVHMVKAMVSSSHVWMWELDHKKDWVLKNWCFWTVVLEKTLESPLDCKEIQPVNPEYSLEGLMLVLKLQYLGHPKWRADSLEKPSCWKRLTAKGERGGRGWDSCITLLTQWTWIWANSGR